MNKSKYPQWVLAAADDISDTMESYAAVIWKHAVLEIAGKDIKIGVQGKVIAAHKDQIASLQAEIVALTAENERLQGGPDFSTHESIQREFDKRFPDEEDTDE